jgi:hypothetical protein
MDFSILDQQLGSFSTKLTSDVGLGADEVGRLASAVAAEVRSLDRASQADIRAASPVPVSDRLQELVAFQSWMDFASTVHGHPGVTRAQVIVQNYVCFVYLGEATFRALRKATPSGSVTRRCSQFLTDNPVRAFRNALAHSNWTYRDDFRGLIFWARKGNNPDEEMSRFEVEQRDLDFWQSLARAVAYAAYSSLDEVWKRAASG